MVKKTLFKYGSVLMSVVLIASTLTACGTNTAYNQTQSDVARQLLIQRALFQMQSRTNYLYQTQVH